MNALRFRWALLQIDWNHWKEKQMLAIAHVLPHWLRYWVTVDSFARATTGKYSNVHPDEVGYSKVMDAL